MKKIKMLFVAGSLLLTGLAFTSCSNSTEEKVQEEIVQEGTWYCPMECEKDDNGNVVMHTEAGQCSICEMDLVEL